MHGCCLDFVKRKEARHTAEREREWEEKENSSKRSGEEEQEGEGGRVMEEGGVDVGRNNLTRECLLAHRYATRTRRKRFSSCLQLV